MDTPLVWHPVRHLAFWKTKEAEVKANEAIYDWLVGDDPMKKKQLDDLLSWARSEAVSDEIYNQGDC